MCNNKTNYNLCPLESFRIGKKKYPRLVKLTKKCLCLPATSASSERVFPTTGNIVSASIDIQFEIIISLFYYFIAKIKIIDIRMI